MRIDLFLEALDVIGTGYLGVFLVTGVIIGAVKQLNRWTKE